MMCNLAQPHSQTQYCLIHGYVVFATPLIIDLTPAEVVGGLNWHDCQCILYTVPTKVVGMLMVSALPTKVVGMQAVYQCSKIKELGLFQLCQNPLTLH